jgi:hypothetical protein
MFFLTDQLKFDRSHETVSVVVGKRALLPCYVSIQDANQNGNSPFKVIIIYINEYKELNQTFL